MCVRGSEQLRGGGVVGGGRGEVEGGGINGLVGSFALQCTTINKISHINYRILYKNETTLII